MAQLATNKTVTGSFVTVGSKTNFIGGERNSVIIFTNATENDSENIKYRMLIDTEDVQDYPLPYARKQIDKVVDIELEKELTLFPKDTKVFLLPDRTTKFTLQVKADIVGSTAAVLDEVCFTEAYVSDIGDEIVKEQVTIDREHEEVHEGKHFICSDFDSNVDIATAKEWLLIAPDTSTRMHFTFSFKATKNGTLEVFEAPTTSNDGTALTVFNNDRNSANTATLQCLKGPTITGDGTLLDSLPIGTDGPGASGGVGGIVLRNSEVILKQDTKYLVRFTAITNDTRVSVRFSWYEE